MNKEIIKEDTNHIHAEIRQLRNQQFLLITAGLTLFGVVVTWFLQKDFSPSGTRNVGVPRFIVEAILLIILFILFYWSRILRNLILIMGTYLRKRDWSYWEQDYTEYAKRARISQMILPTIINLILGTLSLCVVFVTCSSLNWDEGAIWASGIVLVLWIIYVIAISGIGFGEWFYNADAVEKKWETILKQLEYKPTNIASSLITSTRQDKVKSINPDKREKVKSINPNN